MNQNGIEKEEFNVELGDIFDVEFDGVFDKEKKDAVKKVSVLNEKVPGVLTKGVGLVDKKRSSLDDQKKQITDYKSKGGVLRGAVKESDDLESDKTDDIFVEKENVRSVAVITTDGTREGTKLIVNGKRVEFEGLEFEVRNEKAQLRLLEKRDVF